MTAILAHPVARSYERQARLFAKLWRGVAFSTFVQPLLYLGAMGYGLGRFVDEGAGAAELGGLDYLTFVAPGLLCANVMQGAASDSLWPVLGGFKWQATYTAMVTTPITPADVYGGTVLWIATRVGFGAASFLAVAGLLGAVVSWWAVLALPTALLVALAFAAPLAAYSAGVDDDQSFSIIMRLGVLPMFLFSGVFFPLEQLPAALRPIAWLSPLWHGTEMARDFTTGVVDWPLVVGHAAVLGCLVAAGWTWGVRRFTERLWA